MTVVGDDPLFAETDGEKVERWERQDKERADRQRKAVKRGVKHIADKYIAEDGGPPEPVGHADGAGGEAGVAGSKGDDARPAKQADILIELVASAKLFHAMTDKI